MQKIDSFLDDLNFSLEEDGADDAEFNRMAEEDCYEQSDYDNPEDMDIDPEALKTLQDENDDPDDMDSDLGEFEDQDDTEKSKSERIEDIILKDLKKFVTGEPDIIEMRSSIYNHTDERCLLVTISLGLALEAPVLADYGLWGPIIREIIKECLLHVYNANPDILQSHPSGSDTSRFDALDSDVFRPGRFTPYEVIKASDDIAHGKTPSKKELADYLSKHQGPIVVAGDSLYKNFRAKSWMVKVWMVAENGKYNFLLEV